MNVQLHNTLTKQKEPFRPGNDSAVTLFVCGPTVYDFSHIGHAKTYVQFDLLARTLRAAGYSLTYLQNITDIDDKIIDRALERSVTWQELRSTFEQAYLDDMHVLNNVSVSTYARATDHMPDIISQVERLIANGHAYTIAGDGIYFEIATFNEYGKLSGRTEIKENDAQTRIDHSDNKRGWNDFALWKFARHGEPSWPAPFGDGRPGWHIEDTAISEHYFGPQYDLHGGAIDLIFPHHEAEITQMESISGITPFVRYWTHTGFLMINGEKMSKSLGNFFTIRDVIEKGYDPMAIRLLMLQTHYRSSINFTFENLDAAVNRLRNWKAVAVVRHQIHDRLQDDDTKADTGVSPYASKQAILEALADDLNTPEALRLIEEVFSIVSTSRRETIHRHTFLELLEFLDDVLGLQLLSSTPDIDDDVKRLILERERARESKDWQRSDDLRAEIESTTPILIKDTQDGTVWEYAA